MTPELAGLIALLIRSQCSAHVLEIDTSNGYSAIWFADAVRDTGGRVTTVETDVERVEAAVRNIEGAGVSAWVTVVHDDGGNVLAPTLDASVDLVVLDAERPAYADYWPHLRRVLTPYGVVAVDNAVSHGEQLTKFRALLERESGKAGKRESGKAGKRESGKAGKRESGKAGKRESGFAVHLQEVGDGVLTAVRIR